MLVFVLFLFICYYIGPINLLKKKNRHRESIDLIRRLLSIDIGNRWKPNSEKKIIIRDYLTNRPQFSMVFFFFSLQSFEHFMVSFLWSIGVYTMENVVDLFFTVIVFFLRKTKNKTTGTA